MPDPFLVARNLTKVYGAGPSAVTALRETQFTVSPGDRVAILGKSGSGKSTLLNLLGGLDRPTTGSLSVADRELATLTRHQLADYRLTTVGFIFQSFHLIPSRSVLQNVELPLILAGHSPRERTARAREALDAVGMTARLNHAPSTLSGGERQRTAIARALVNKPPLLLADEPTGNLDSATATTVMELIQQQVRDRGMTMILVTHDEDLARRTTDRTIRMADGQVIEDRLN